MFHFCHLWAGDFRRTWRKQNSLGNLCVQVLTSGMHLFRFDSVISKASVKAGEVNTEACANPDSGEEHWLERISDLGPFLKHVEKSWWPLGHTVVDSLTWGSPEWEQAGGSALHVLRELVMVLGLLPPAVWVVAKRRSGTRQRLHGFALLRGHLLRQDALLMLCLVWQRDNSLFYAFLSDILQRRDICNCFLYEKGKKYPKRLILQIGWCNKQINP